MLITVFTLITDRAHWFGIDLFSACVPGETLIADLNVSGFSIDS